MLSTYQLPSSQRSWHPRVESRTVTMHFRNNLLVVAIGARNAVGPLALTARPDAWKPAKQNRRVKPATGAIATESTHQSRCTRPASALEAAQQQHRGSGARTTDAQTQ